MILLVIIYASFISLGLPDSLLGAAWPVMYGRLGVPLHYAGFISMLIAGGTVVSSMASARLIRRFGTGWVTAVSVAMTAAALTGFSLSHAFIALCLCAIPLGLGAGSVDAALNNYVALHFKARHMSWLHCFWGLGASIGPVIMAAFLTGDGSWNLGYRAIGLIQWGLVVLLFIALPLWGKTPAPAPKGVSHLFEDAPAAAPAPLRVILKIAGVKQAMLTFFCYCAIESITGLWGSSYLVTARNIAPETAAQWIALYFIGITAGRFAAGFVTMKLSNRQMVRLGQAIIACGVIMLVLPVGNGVLLAGLFIMGLGCAPIFPSLLHETPLNFGEGNSQAIMGIQMASAYIGTAFMPPLFGRLAAVTGFTLFPLFIGLVLLIKIVVVELLNRKVDAALQGRKE
jgi:fucose permease